MISLDKKLTLGTVQFGMNYGLSKNNLINQKKITKI